MRNLIMYIKKKNYNRGSLNFFLKTTKQNRSTSIGNAIFTVETITHHAHQHPQPLTTTQLLPAFKAQPPSWRDEPPRLPPTTQLRAVLP